MFDELLQKLVRIPGASYCCVADGARGTVLQSSGNGTGVHLAVLGRGTAAAGYLAGAHDELAELDELIVTTRRAYHLVRELDGSTEPLLVYLRLDRARADLTSALQVLAATGARTGRPTPPRSRPVVDLSREGPVPPTGPAALLTEPAPALPRRTPRAPDGARRAVVPLVLRRLLTTPRRRP